MDFEFFKDAFKVFLDSSIADRQASGNLGSAEPPCNKGTYFNLSPRK